MTVAARDTRADVDEDRTMETWTCGRAIRAARFALGLRQEQLADELGISRRTLSRWEHDRWPPPAGAMREMLLEALRKAPASHVAELARALELEPPAPAVPYARAAPLHANDDRAAPPLTLDAVLLAAAEELDVSPRGLRGFAIDLLEAVDRAGLSAHDAAAALRPAAAKKGGG